LAKKGTHTEEAKETATKGQESQKETESKVGKKSGHHCAVGMVTRVASILPYFSLFI